MADFDLNHALGEADSYHAETKRRARNSITNEMNRLNAEARRLEGLLSASQARDEAATELLRDEVRRTVRAEALAEHWQAEADRLRQMVETATDPSEGADRG